MATSRIVGSKALVMDDLEVCRLFDNFYDEFWEDFYDPIEGGDLSDVELGKMIEDYVVDRFEDLLFEEDADAFAMYIDEKRARIFSGREEIADMIAAAHNEGSVRRFFTRLAKESRTLFREEL